MRTKGQCRRNINPTLHARSTEHANARIDGSNGMNGVLDDLRISRRNRDVTANEFRRFDGKEGRCEMCEVRCPSD